MRERKGAASREEGRRSIRLAGYDYAQPGGYFVTICTQDREPLLGEVFEMEMHLSEVGHIASEEWVRSAQIRPGLTLDEFIVMPNHIHGIVVITDVVGAHSCAPLPDAPLPDAPLRQRQPRSLPSFVAQFKATATRRINDRRGTPGTQVWQRNYYEHIVRNDEELERIRQYIESNPAHWAEDDYYIA